jgi:hypothetical protein
MPTPNKVIVSANLHAFFHKEVVQSRSELGVMLSEAAEYYLVNLLVHFSHRDDVVNLYQDEPLIVLHRRAQQAPLAEQFTIFKQLADYALYVAGFFAEYIERSLVNMDYYLAMGTAAYANVVQLCTATRKPQALQAVYQELTDQFMRMVIVLNQVSTRARQRNSRDVDLLKLYDRYVRTQNDRAKKMLVGHGLAVDDLSGAKRVTGY